MCVTLWFHFSIPWIEDSNWKLHCLLSKYSWIHLMTGNKTNLIIKITFSLYFMLILLFLLPTASVLLLFVKYIMSCHFFSLSLSSSSPFFIILITMNLPYIYPLCVTLGFYFYHPFVWFTGGATWTAMYINDVKDSFWDDFI